MLGVSKKNWRLQGAGGGSHTGPPLNEHLLFFLDLSQHFFKSSPNHFPKIPGNFNSSESQEKSQEEIHICMKHFMTREYMLIEATQEDWEQFDPTDSFELGVMRDFAVDNPEDKEHLWNALINPLVPLDGELRDLLEKHVRNFRRISVELPEGTSKDFNDLLKAIGGRYRNQIAELSFQHVFGVINNSFLQGRTNKEPDSWHYIKSMIVRVYSALKSLTRLLKNQEFKQVLEPDGDEIERLSDQMLKLLISYRQKRFGRLTSPYKPDDDNRVLRSVLMRAFDHGVGVRLITHVEEWARTKNVRNRDMALRFLNDAINSGQSSATGGTFSERALRDLRFIRDFITKRSK